jgi:predicted HicB family RNase H-like nuclease
MVSIYGTITPIGLLDWKSYPTRRLTMKNTLKYKDYIAKFELDLDDEVLVGKVINTSDFIQFHAESVPKLIDAFHNTIDEYLEFCKKKGVEPGKSYSGEFRWRLGPELHRDLTIQATKENISMNDLANSFVREMLKKNHVG